MLKKGKKTNNWIIIRFFLVAPGGCRDSGLSSVLFLHFKNVFEKI
jgi:hypothetical protein